MTPANQDPPRRRSQPGDHAYAPPPLFLPAFPDVTRLRPKYGRFRWKDRRGRLYEWDRRHGALEVYDAQGRHLGEFDHETGHRRKPADKTRRIEP